ncbi:DNA-binding protein [Streptomyces tateyamensis]|uniref:DNA-binding protein n=1 Tax=Streptomyces tateyamensis TaxID=565073 RepID=A0A2V4N0R2_9ACTN|nr:XRE family transcriptional regulator [Streptomyces tateyamensis]PYC74111.1 DNA-binding protein [Streptomyces tateyamensis]
MGEIDEGLERTKPIPVHLNTRVRFLWEKVAKEDTAKLAKAAGVSQRTAQRWAHALKAVAEGRLTGDIPMTRANAAKVEQAVRTAWQPRVKNRVRRQAEKSGFMLHISATFGFSSAGGSTDDPRPRMITHKMPGDVAKRLYEARDTGASQAQQEALLAQALRDHYFKDNGRRAAGLDVELNDISWMDLEL